MFSSALLVSLLVAAPAKLAMPALSAGAGVSVAVAQTVGEAVAAELRRYPEVQLITDAELNAVLTHDAQMQALGCGSDTCMAQIGGAVGARWLVTGSVARLGESWLIFLKLLDVKAVKTVKQANRRLKNTGPDALLDSLPSLVAQVIAPTGAELSAKEAAPAKTVTAPAGGLDEELSPAPPRDGLQLFTDGKKHYLALGDYKGTSTPLFWGDAKALWAQRLVGSGKSGPASFSYTVWDPRAPSGWQRSVEGKEGKLHLQCGDTRVELTAVAKPLTKKILSAAQFLAPRWRRQAFVLARDDEGTYYYVDRGRSSALHDDFRLFVGKRGKLAYLPLDDALVDGGGMAFLSPQGRLTIKGEPAVASWIALGVEHKLNLLQVEDEAAFIYATMGVYKEALGTICDAALGR